MEIFNLRQVYVKELIAHAKRNDRIVSLDCDSREATMTDQFAAVFPERSFSVGIAEQNLVSFAGGMSTMGLIPFVNSYSMFIAMRALDQVRNSVAYPNLNVKFVLSHHGLDAGVDGVTHQLTEDVAIFRCIPNLKLLHPVDVVEMVQMVEFAVKTPGPVIIKSGKSSVPNVHSEDFKWEYGKPALVASGEGCAIIASGVMVHRALKARDELKSRSVAYPKVITMSCMTDVDANELLRLTEDIRYVITMEDHSIYGGLGGIISEIFSEHRPTKVIRIGLKGRFAESGFPDELFGKYRMDANEIVRIASEQG